MIEVSLVFGVGTSKLRVEERGCGDRHCVGGRGGRIGGVECWSRSLVVPNIADDEDDSVKGGGSRER